MGENEQKDRALTRNKWIILIIIIILGGTYTALILLLIVFLGESIPIMNALLLFLSLTFPYGPFVLISILSFLLTRKIKISLVAGIISFVLNWIIILIIIGAGIASLMH